MRQAFVCFFPAFPPESGAGRVSYDLARFVPGESILIQLGSVDADWLDSTGLRVIQFAQGWDGRWGKLGGIFRFVRRIVERLEATQPDVVILEGASWVLYHWWLLRAIRKRLPRVKVVYHAHNVEYLLRSDRHGVLVPKITRFAEGALLRAVDHAFAVSDADRDAFQSLYGTRPSLLPNGVDLSQFADVSEDAIAACRERYGLGSSTILFMGSYAYPPNREAIDLLVNEVMPRVLERRPDARLAIIGGEVPYRRDWLLSPGVIPDEWVAPFVSSCALSVAPIFSGSGTRLKIIESLAAGVPVVATPKGAEGLHLVGEGGLLLRSSVSGFIESITGLLDDCDYRCGLRMRGAGRVARLFDWRGIAENFATELRMMVSQSG